MTQITAGMRSIRSIATVPLTSNLSVHACPLASDSKAARVRRPRYSRVNIRAYASAIRVTRVCARVTSTRSTRERVSIASIPRPLPPRKKVEGLGTRLACPLCVNLVHAFERERVHFRVLASTRVCVCVCEYSRATREGCQVARERHCRLRAQTANKITATCRATHQRKGDPSIRGIGYH